MESENAQLTGKAPEKLAKIIKSVDNERLKHDLNSLMGLIEGEQPERNMIWVSTPDTSLNVIDILAENGLITQLQIDDKQTIEASLRARHVPSNNDQFAKLWKVKDVPDVVLAMIRNMRNSSYPESLCFFRLKSDRLK